MEDNAALAALGVIALILVCLEARRISELEQTVGLLVDGDVETARLFRKIKGYPAVSGSD